MTTQSKEVQDWLNNPRKAISLAKGGSRKHVLAIPTTIPVIYAHLRHTALEVFLIHCSNEDQNLELAEALLKCIGRLESDLQNRQDSAHSPHNLERLIVRHSEIIYKTLQFYAENSSLFNKKSIEVDASMDSPALETRIEDTACCLTALCMNREVSPAIFKDMDALRIPIRFWLATVLASKPGEVCPLVHQVLYYCGNPYFSDRDESSRFFNLLVEENDGDAFGIVDLLVSELKVVARDIDVKETNTLLKDTLFSLIHLNMMLLIPCSDNSPRHPNLKCNSTSIFTSAVLKSIQLEDQHDNEWQIHLTVYFVVIHDLLNTRDGARWAVDAIQAGALTVIVTAANLTSRRGCSLTEQNAKDIRITIGRLSLYLIRQSVVRAAANAIASIEPENLERLKSLPFFAEWMSFQSTVLERAVFMAQLGRKIESPERKLHCEFCLEMIPLRDLKKCERCKRTFYCSRSCQTMDWRQSDHKTICASLQAESDSDHHTTMDRFYMGHFAFYDIRRHMKSLIKISHRQYSGIPANELYFRVHYVSLEGPIHIAILPLSERKSSSEFFTRVSQQSNDHSSGPHLVEVLYAGAKSKFAHSARYILPPSYSFGVPNLLDQYRDIADSVKVSFRSKAEYWIQPGVEIDEDLVRLSGDVDEVDAILSFMQLTKGGSGDPAFFPLIFKYSWKDIENAALDCRSCWPFDSEGIL
ncbi:hypothetical protein SCHPADRAFT_1000909 [Schizopora paradoxa]|uniref:MYND-type domain-containing protein n=1 Tax=Schizopora paradoxa TaxID=27342 RepID=A0A0H2RAT3_9AGAM|nr:hypothetical protein SCHPADRAFT_1000909 [Schizopora paradoxa]